MRTPYRLPKDYTFKKLEKLVIFIIARLLCVYTRHHTTPYLYLNDCLFLYTLTYYSFRLRAKRSAAHCSPFIHSQFPTHTIPKLEKGKLSLKKERMDGKKNFHLCVCFEK